MEINKTSCVLKQPQVSDIDLGLVKVEPDVTTEFDIIEKMGMHWEQTPQKQRQQPKPFHRGQRMVNWREAEVNYLIDLVKSNAYVWNSSVPDFKKKHKKAQFWELAADKINAILHPRTPFTRSDCFKKWNNLRTYFQADMKSVKTKNNGGISDVEDSMCGGGWKYSSKMSFLISSRSPSVSVNTFNNSDHSVFDTTTSLSDSNGESEMELCEPNVLLEAPIQQTQDNDCSQSNPHLDDLHQQPSSELPQAKRKKTLAEPSENTLLYTMVNNVSKLSGLMTSQLNKEETSQSYYFSKYVGQCLDKLDPDLNLEAREKISEILFKYERAQLKRQ